MATKTKAEDRNIVAVEWEPKFGSKATQVCTLAPGVPVEKFPRKDGSFGYKLALGWNNSLDFGQAVGFARKYAEDAEFRAKCTAIVQEMGTGNAPKTEAERINRKIGVSIPGAAVTAAERAAVEAGAEPGIIVDILSACSLADITQAVRGQEYAMDVLRAARASMP